ncbi:MAG: DNA helicase, partial [Candidatus Pacebacteria bacterium]|nr:DNA helicase [Candidatus Paceibacterota bacterium]
MQTQLILDLHLHSHYSRATSKNMDLEHIYRWGKIKGINVIGTADFIHPAWLQELQTKLEPAEPGLFKLKDQYAQEQDKTLPESVKNQLMRFIFTTEISTIYSKNDRVRKLHNVIVMPSFKAIAKFNHELQKIGNLKADGRPILGLDSKKLLQLTLETDPEAFFIPAHIWTPWFSMFGSKSGFDTIEAAFEELTPKISAIETGLSSDPFMNWRVDQLKDLTIVSNSDAHSPQKLGREANVLNCELSYPAIIETLKTNDQRMVGTIEFYPQEGKYHYDGHRKCQICLAPEKTKKHQNLCPKCGQPLVLGVDYRVNELADHPADYQPQKHKQVEYIIPLAEIIAEIKGVKSTKTKTVQTEYQKIYQALGNEFKILRQLSPTDIKQAGFAILAQAIKKMRAQEIIVKPGYDGVYG